MLYYKETKEKPIKSSTQAIDMYEWFVEYSRSCNRYMNGRSIVFFYVISERNKRETSLEVNARNRHVGVVGRVLMSTAIDISMVDLLFFMLY